MNSATTLLPPVNAFTGGSSRQRGAAFALVLARTIAAPMTLNGNPARDLSTKAESMSLPACGKGRRQDLLLHNRVLRIPEETELKNPVFAVRLTGRTPEFESGKSRFDSSTASHDAPAAIAASHL